MNKKKCAHCGYSFKPMEERRKKGKSLRETWEKSRKRTRLPHLGHFKTNKLEKKGELFWFSEQSGVKEEKRGVVVWRL